MTIFMIDGEMKEYVTTEDQNFIMVKRTNQSRAATVHPSGLQLNPAKQLSVLTNSPHYNQCNITGLYMMDDMINIYRCQESLQAIRTN